MYALCGSGWGAGPVTTQPIQRVANAAQLLDWMRAVSERADREAFARLFAHFAPRLIAFFARGGLPRDSAEEVAQETMIAVWTKARLYNSAEAGVSTWIYTIARNARIDRLRREGRRSKLETEVAAEDDEGLEISGEDTLLALERDERVRAAVSGLPPEQAEVVRMSFFADKPHAEIARELGIPLGTVKSRLRLAMAKIRLAWEQEA
jgi:RNA polymerase sigma-70 factor (ECF subfamily)